MLEILIIFFTGKYFYRLAEDYNQNKWLYAIIGVVTYFIGAVIGGAILGLIEVVFQIGIDWTNSFLLTLILMPFAVGVCYVLHYLLKRNWDKKGIIVKDEIQDIGKPLE
jgi:branched-subunit amino acid ABC-type transport system permease component